MPGRRKTRRVKRGGDITEITTVLDDEQKEEIETYIGVDVDELVDAMNLLLSPPAGANTSAARSIVADARLAMQEADDETYLEQIDNLGELFAEFDEKMGNATGGRRRRGGIPRDVVEGLADAYQKGVADAKMVVFKRYQTPPGFRLEQVIHPLVRKHPGVEESRIREEYVKGFTETRLPNPGANRGGRRKTRRGGVSKEMVDALREAENTGRIHKTVGDPSQADSVADSLMRRFRLADVGTPPTPRTLLRDKYLASYNQSSRATTRGSFLEGLQSRIANLLS